MASNRLLSQFALASAAVVSGASVGIAGGAVQASGISRVVLQPLATGGLVAIVLMGIATAVSLGSPRWPAALLAGVVAVLTVHVWLYGAAMENRQQQVAKQPAVELFRPGWADQSFWDFMRSEASDAQLAYWILDACLLVGITVVMVEAISRHRDPVTDVPSSGS